MTRLRHRRCSGDTGTFWPYTFLRWQASLLGAALALAGVLPVLGWIVAALALVGALTGTFVMHDWPPFLNYVILMVLSIGLIRAG